MKKNRLNSYIIVDIKNGRFDYKLITDTLKPKSVIKK